MWDSYGHQKEYHHQRGLVIQRRDALGAVQKWRYSPTAELEHYTDPLGNRTRYEHDGRGNQTRVTYPDGATVATQFNAQDLPVQGTDANGGIWQWEYDAWGRLGSSTNPAGAVTCYSYDARGRLAELTNALGHVTRLRYDAQGNLVHTVAPDGGIRSQEYDALGQVVKLTDATGHVQHRRYDHLGQLTGMQLPNNSFQHFAYDAEGNVVHTNDGHQTVEFLHGPMGQVVQRRQGGQHVQFTYDREGNLTGLRNEQNDAYEFGLDAAGRVVEEVGFDGLTRRYVRDAAGRVTHVERPAGRTTDYTYDAAGRVTEVLHNETERTSYRYRADGTLLEAANHAATVRVERDPLGRVLAETQDGHAVRSSYDARGQRLGLTSSLGAAIRFERDALGQVRHTYAGTWESRVERDAEGLELHRQLSGGLRTGWQRDTLGRPTSQRLMAGNGFPRQRRHQWQGTDQLMEIDDSRDGSTRFAYDEWDNLAKATYPDGAQELRQPDAVGNLFRKASRTDRQYGQGGQLREDNGTRYRYDAEGNLTQKKLPHGQTWHYAWDGAGQLASVTRPDGYAVTFTYDALGRRVSKRFRGRLTRWVWDGDKPLHEWHELEVGPEAGTAADLATWLFEEDSFAPAAKLTAKGHFSVICDHLGTPLAMYDGQGNPTWEMTLDSYGGVQQGKGKSQDCPFRYQGQYEDAETGLYYNRFRYYDPETGNYISQDPIGVLGGHRLYAYASNPLARVDVFGLAPCTPGLPGTATIHHHPNASFGHYSIEIRALDEAGAVTRTRFSHQVTNPAGTKTMIEMLEGPHGEATLSSAPIALPDAEAAIRYQQKVGHVVTGPYSVVDNSCATHVSKVLRAGGVEVPTGYISEIKYLKRLPYTPR